MKDSNLRKNKAQISLDSNQLLQAIEQLNQVEFDALFENILQMQERRQRTIQSALKHEDVILQRLVVSGLASWSGKKPVITEPVKLSQGGQSLGAMVIEDRG